MTYSIYLKSALILLLSSSALKAQNISPSISKNDSIKRKPAESLKMKTLFSDNKNYKLKSWGISFSPMV
jgi:hypothetical protein